MDENWGYPYGLETSNSSMWFSDCPWNSLLLKMAIEIVDLPIKNCDFPSFSVWPEGKIHPPSGSQACLAERCGQGSTGHLDRISFHWTGIPKSTGFPNGLTNYGAVLCIIYYGLLEISNIFPTKWPCIGIQPSFRPIYRMVSFKWWYLSKDFGPIK